MSEHDDSSSTPAVFTRPRDLIDFHLRWRSYRPFALDLADRRDLSGDERELIRWLIALADRVGHRDLSDD